MKKTIGCLLFIVMICGSCREKLLTGDLTITTNGVNGINGRPLNEFKIGLYDTSAPTNNGNFTSPYAIMTASIVQNQVEFHDINVGNYVVAIVGTSIFHAVQVRGDKNMTFNITD